MAAEMTTTTTPTPLVVGETIVAQSDANNHDQHLLEECLAQLEPHDPFMVPKTHHHLLAAYHDCYLTSDALNELTSAAPLVAMLHVATEAARARFLEIMNDLRELGYLENCRNKAKPLKDKHTSLFTLTHQAFDFFRRRAHHSIPIISDAQLLTILLDPISGMHHKTFEAYEAVALLLRSVQLPPLLTQSHILILCQRLLAAGYISPTSSHKEARPFANDHTVYHFTEAADLANIKQSAHVIQRPAVSASKLLPPMMSELESNDHKHSHHDRGTFLIKEAVEFLMSCDLFDPFLERLEARDLLRTYHQERLIAPVDEQHNTVEDDHYFRFTGAAFALLNSLQRRRYDDEQLISIVVRNLKVSDHKHHLHTYKSSFTGAHAINYLLESDLFYPAYTPLQAKEVFERFLLLGYIKHAFHHESSVFDESEKALYVFLPAALALSIQPSSSNPTS